MKKRIEGLVVELKPYEYSADIHKMQLHVYANGVLISSSRVVIVEDDFESMLSLWLKHAEQEILENKKRCDAVDWDKDKLLEMQVE